MSPERIVVPGVAEATACRATGSTATRCASGIGGPHRLLDRAVEPVVVDEVAVAILARFLEPGQRADQFVVAAPERDRRHASRAAAPDSRPRAVTSARNSRRRGIEIAGEHEVLPDQQAELVAEIVEEIAARRSRRPRRGSCSCWRRARRPSSSSRQLRRRRATAARRPGSSWRRGRRSRGR